MSKDDLPATSKDANLRRRTLLVEELLAGETKPSRTLTPSQRKELADALRFARRVKWDKTLIVRR